MIDRTRWRPRSVRISVAAALCFMLPAGAVFSQEQNASPASQPTSPRSAGERVYVDEGCAVCHGLIGHGGVGPALQGDKFLAMGDFVAAQILLGRGQMPGFADRLSDNEIAAVASYVRDSWGNHFGQVTPKEVQQRRAKLKPSN